MWVNQSTYWGEVGTVVTAQWYGERAVAMGVDLPEVVTTSIGILIDGVIVATPVTEDTQRPE